MHFIRQIGKKITYRYLGFSVCALVRNPTAFIFYNQNILLKSLKTSRD